MRRAVSSERKFNVCQNVNSMYVMIEKGAQLEIKKHGKAINFRT